MDLTLIRIAGYSRSPRWRAELRNWSSIDAVEFECDAEPRQLLVGMAKQLLDESERECAID